MHKSTYAASYIGGGISGGGGGGVWVNLVVLNLYVQKSGVPLGRRIFWSGEAMSGVGASSETCRSG